MSLPEQVGRAEAGRGAGRLGRAGAVLSPGLALAVGVALDGGGRAALFPAGAPALALAAAVGAFGPGGAARRLGTVLGAAAGAAVAALLLGAGADGAAAAGLLALASGLAGAGPALLGGRVGVPATAAGALGLLAFLPGLTALAWADPLAERLPLPRRWALRQAALHLDLSTAWAYDVADVDRLRDPRVYAEVPLASSVFGRPRATGTAAAWGGYGAALLALAGAWGWCRAGAGRTADRTIPR